MGTWTWCRCNLCDSNKDLVSAIRKNLQIPVEQMNEEQKVELNLLWSEAESIKQTEKSENLKQHLELRFGHRKSREEIKCNLKSNTQAVVDLDYVSFGTVLGKCE